MRGPLNNDNYDKKFLKFESRQAGVSIIYSPEKEIYTYNAYCLEAEKLVELMTVEYDYLDDALQTVNQEFGTWELVPYELEKSDCGSCGNSG
ncbi:MAG: hypothetical protein AB8C84_07210 [Oligoflexales bacterium]